MTLTEWIFRTLSLLLILLAGFAIAWGFVADRVRGRTRQPRCPKCWYDLSGVAEHEASKWRCSECGFVATRVAQLHKSRKRWWTIVPALLFSVMSILAWEWPTIDRGGWRAAVPTWTIVHFWPIDEIAWAEGAGGGDMAYELDRRIDTNQVSASLLDAWAKRVEASYNRSRVLRKSTLNGAPVLVRVGLEELLAALGVGGQRFFGDPAAAERADQMDIGNKFSSDNRDQWSARLPPSAGVSIVLGNISELVQNDIARDSWVGNGGLDGTVRACGTTLLLVNSRDVCEQTKRLVSTITDVVKRVTKGEIGASASAIDEEGYRIVVRDVGDIPLVAARPDAWVEERASEVSVRIIDAIDSDTWIDNGGNDGFIEIFGRLLIIRHTPEVQARIDEQLKQWRAEAAANAK